MSEIITAKVLSFDETKYEYEVDPLGNNFLIGLRPTVDLHCCAPEQLRDKDPKILIGKIVTFRARPLSYLAHDLLEVKDE